MFVDNNHRTWDKHLHELRYAINTATQSSTHVSPSFLNFGRNPEPVKSLRRELENRVEIIPISEQDWIERLKKVDALRDLVCKHINKATARQMTYYNKGRKEVKFFVGDKVWLQTHLLSNAAEGFKAKLGPPRDGPYTIKEVKSNEIYVLDMGGSKKLDEVHVSQISRYNEPRTAKQRKDK